MLSTIKKNITLNATSQVDGKDVEGYSATINSESPEDINISSWQIDKKLYKANRLQCRADQAEFEDYAYTEQDKLLLSQTE